MNWKLTLFAWALFFFGLVIELSVDFALRMQDRNPKTGGLSSDIYYGVQIILFLFAFYLSVLGTRDFQKRINRTFIVLLQIAIGFVLYLFILFSYVLGFEIDSF